MKEEILAPRVVWAKRLVGGALHRMVYNPKENKLHFEINVGKDALGNERWKDVDEDYLEIVKEEALRDILKLPLQD
jgi:hypothetical protein